MWTLTFDLKPSPISQIYLHGATVALLPPLHEAVPTDRRGLDAEVVWFIQQAGGAAVQQVFLIVAAAAAAEGPRNIPAEETHLNEINVLDG